MPLICQECVNDNFIQNLPFVLEYNLTKKFCERNLTLVKKWD